MAFNLKNANIKQVIGISIIFIFEINLQNYVFLQNMAIFFPLMSFLNPCKDGNVHRCSKTKEVKVKAFKATEEKIKQKIGLQGIFILEIKLQKYIFLAKYDHFSAGNASFLNRC